MSFWGKLLGIGSAIAAPFTGGTSLAFLPGALGVGSAVANAFGGSGGSGSTDSALNPMFTQQQQNLQRIGDIGASSVSAGNRALGPALGYYGQLLSGNRGAALEAVAPEVGGILNQYDTARRSASQFAPVGGGRTRQLAEMPFEKIGAIQNLLYGARRDAAAKAADLGTTLRGQGIQSLGSQIAGQGGLLDTGLDLQKLLYEQSKAKGAAIGNLINSLLGSVPGIVGAFKKPAPAPVAPPKIFTPDIPTLPREGWGTFGL